jgi:hypothetical protein
LKFVLEPRNAEILDPEYAAFAGGKLHGLVGILSYRVLSLSLPDANALLAGCTDRDEIKSKFERHNVIGFVLRHETLRSDLAELLSKKLRNDVRDLHRALEFVKTEPPSNPSQRIDLLEAKPRLGGRLEKQLWRREWLMYECFNYRRTTE